MIRRIFPHPLMSVTLALVWLLLANDMGLGHLLMGMLLGVLIPLFTNAFWPERPRLARPGKILALGVRLLTDIVIANFSVARTILWPGAKPQSEFVHYPLELRNEFAVTVLTCLISLTPGTVCTDLSKDRKILLIHALDVVDKKALIAVIKRRYEHPLQEIFPC